MSPEPSSPVVMPRVYPLRLPPRHLLACPACGAACGQGLEAETQYCSRCGLQYFDLGGMPCWFPNGVQQKVLWNTELGLTLRGAAQKLEHHQCLREQVDVLPSVRNRLTKVGEGLRQIYTSLANLMANAGLTAEIDPQSVENCPNTMLHFLDLLLRDWAWDTQANAQHRAVEESENEGALRRVQAALEASGGTDNLGDLVVLGAGAGRLSWDIHRHFKPTCTLALDISHLLAITAHQLIAQQQTLLLTELPADIQAGLDLQQLWSLQAQHATPELASHWFFMAADAWHCPLRAGSFDVVVTPWFIDVSSRDIRELIALVSKLLKPGGRWINTGPLLYSKNIPAQQRYTHSEVVELMELAGFDFSHHSLETVNFLNSPLLAKGRREQIWTFAARQPAAEFVNYATEFPPPWLQLTHLPIPKNIVASPQGQPVLRQLLGLVDGRISINQIAAQMAPNLGPEEDALGLVKGVFAQMLLAAAERAPPEN